MIMKLLLLISYFWKVHTWHVSIQQQNNFTLKIADVLFSYQDRTLERSNFKFTARNWNTENIRGYTAENKCYYNGTVHCQEDTRALVITGNVTFDKITVINLQDLDNEGRNSFDLLIGVIIYMYNDDGRSVFSRTIDSALSSYSFNLPLQIRGGNSLSVIEKNDCSGDISYDDGRFISCDEMDPKCPLETDYFRGSTLKAKRWQPYSCNLTYISSARALSCLQNKSIFALGDSTLNELVFELIAFLEVSRFWVLDPDWLFDQTTCENPDNMIHLTIRSLSTSRGLRLIPNLAAHNITINFLWNAHTAICENNGPFQDMIKDPLWLERMKEVALYYCHNGSCDSSNRKWKKKFDIGILGMGIHFSPGETNRPHTGENHEDIWHEGINNWLDWVQRHSERHVWKDISPGLISSTQGPWLELMHAAARGQVLQRINRQQPWTIWPVHQVLTERNIKNAYGYTNDWRHCSRMHWRDYNATKSEIQMRDFRTPVCQSAVQILLNKLCL